MTNKAKNNHSLKAYRQVVDEFKNESDRAVVILGAAKMDSLLSQILDRRLLPSLSSSDELLDGDSPLATFSARINASYRLGLITPNFAKSLHMVRKIRNSFAHEVSGVSLESGSHADRVHSLLLPLRSLPFFVDFRDAIIGEDSGTNNFRACLALMIARLEACLNCTEQIDGNDSWEFIVKTWSDENWKEKNTSDADAA